MSIIVTDIILFSKSGVSGLDLYRHEIWIPHQVQKLEISLPYTCGKE